MNLAAFVAEHGQTGTAKILGVSQGLVWQWLNDRTAITAERAIDMEAKSDGAMTRIELRPDIFGPSSRAAPAQAEAQQ